MPKSMPTLSSSRPIHRGADGLLLRMHVALGDVHVAVAEVAAYAGGSAAFKAQTDPKLQADMKDTFLQKASRKTHINTEPITGAKVRLAWADGHTDEVEIKSSLRHDLPDEKVKYLP